MSDIDDNHLQDDPLERRRLFERQRGIGDEPADDPVTQDPETEEAETEAPADEPLAPEEAEESAE